MFIVVMACALLTLLLPLLTAGLSASHGPVMGSKLPQFMPAQSDESDVFEQAHADHSTEDGQSGHAHGHSNVDHMHEPLCHPPVHTIILALITLQWSLRRKNGALNTHVGVLERPPKPIAA